MTSEQGSAVFEKHLESLFCDDVRHEEGGKRTFVGTYNTVMYVPSFPVLLPKFAVFIKALSPTADPFRKLTIRVLQDDTVLFQSAETDVMKRSAGPELETIEGFSFTKPLHVVEWEVMFSPLTIEQQCSIRIRATDESGKEYAAAALLIAANQASSR